MRRSLLLCAASALALLPAGAQTPFPTDSALHALIKQRVDDKRSAGIVLGILEPGGRSRFVAYGDPGPSQPALDANTVFEIGSITKVFTSTVLAQMVQEGKVRLEDPAQKYLTGVTLPAYQGKPITLVSLAEQNSGLPRMPSNFRPANPANPYADYTVAQMYEFLGGYTLPRAPGAQFEYSNLGVGLLGHILATVDGKSYEQMLKDRIFTPLAMTQTAITLTPAMRQRLALGHNPQGEVVSNWDISALAGAGAIRSTAADMLKFADANLHPERGPLHKAMALALAPRSDAGNNMRIGLNWISMAAGADTIVWHNGGTGGYRTWLGLAPSQRRAVLVLTNTGGVGADDVGMHLLAPSIPLAPKPAPVKQRVAITLPADSLAPYAGSYQAAGGLTLEVTFADGVLSVQPAGQQKLRLWAETATDFFVKEADVQFSFVRDASGKVTTMVIHQNGGNLPAAKIR